MIVVLIETKDVGEANETGAEAVQGRRRKDEKNEIGKDRVVNGGLKQWRNKKVMGKSRMRQRANRASIHGENYHLGRVDYGSKIEACRLQS